MKKYAVIVAGGTGSRMGAPIPKQFLPILGKPLLWYTLEVFLDSYPDLEVVLVLPADRLDEGRNITAITRDPKRIRVAKGGGTRFHSVQNGLDGLEKDSIIFVHDGVRCLLSVGLIHRCHEQACRSGSAIPVIDSRDSVRLLTADGNEAVDRSRVKLVQTPQTFQGSILLPAYTVEFQERFTDEATVVEAAGFEVGLIEGETDNIKITGPADLAIAERVLARRS